MMKSSSDKILNDEGIALPLALMFIMVVSILGSIFSRMATDNLSLVKQAEATSDAFGISEGAVHDTLRQMVINPNLWRQRVNLSASPSSYSTYSPASYAATNGIPSCAGLSCERHLFPTGGGLIKNFGPIGAEGDAVDTSYDVTEQLDSANLPTSDITINSKSGWVQVERLDETMPGSQNLGADLSNNAQAGANASIIRFRLTGTTLRAVKGRNGVSTVVIIVEVPNA